MLSAFGCYFNVFYCFFGGGGGGLGTDGRGGGGQLWFLVWYYCPLGPAWVQRLQHTHGERGKVPAVYLEYTV